MLKVSAALAVCAGALCARAQVDLLIAEYKFNDARFSAVRTDGTNPRTLFDLPSSMWLPLGMDYDVPTGRLLWVDSAGPSELMSATLSGGGMTTVADLPGFARTVARDALGRVYFSTGHRIMRVNADGTGLSTVFTGSDSFFTASNPCVDATNGHVYVGHMGRLYRTDLDGSNVRTITTKGSSIRAIGLDVARRTIYWLDADPHSDLVARVGMDGSGFTVIHDASPGVAQSSGLIDLIVDGAGGSLYFADELAGKVYRTNLDGTGLVTLFTSAGGRSPSGLALSAGSPAQPLNDCNGNGVADDLDIAAGAPDCDANGVPDSCQADPCPAWVFLLDQGSNATESSGVSIGVPGVEAEIFQQFDVPAPGWTIGQIGLDGYTVQHVNGMGFTATIHPDDGGDLPDEGVTLGASGPINYYFNPHHENWVYETLDATLAPGRYWIRLRANQPGAYWGFVNLGTSGLPSVGRIAGGPFGLPGAPISLRLIQGNPCAADYNGDASADILDFLDFFDDFSACEGQPGPCGTLGDADVNEDATVDILDFLDFFEAFSAGC